MNICIFMPTMRHWNWPRIIDAFKAGQHPDVFLRWMPVLYESEEAAFPPEVMDFLWAWRDPGTFEVSPLILPGKCGPEGPVTNKNNCAIDALLDEKYEGWIASYADDNIMPACFCRRWLEGRQKRIIVCSHLRGQRAAGSIPHHTSPLIARPENMCVGGVSGEQYLIHNSVFAETGLRLEPGITGDGQLISKLWGMMPQEFHFIPDFFIPFNGLDPERWDDAELQKVLSVV